MSLSSNFSLNNNFACLLVFHGSRNRQYSIAMSELVNLVRKQLARKSIITSNWQQKEIFRGGSDLLATITYHTEADSITSPLVEAAALEFAEVSLAQSIVNFAQKAIAFNYRQVVIIPVFLSAGVHVKEDIPSGIAKAKDLLNDSIELQLLDYVGSYPQLTNLIEQQFARIGAEGRILLAHGSRLALGNVACKQLARKVHAINAYWTVSPDLASVVEQSSEQKSSIAIVPYFLFEGRITYAIAEKVAELQARFPQTKLLLDRPFGTSPLLARIISDRFLEITKVHCH